MAINGNLTYAEEKQSCRITLLTVACQSNFIGGETGTTANKALAVPLSEDTSIDFVCMNI